MDALLRQMRTRYPPVRKEKTQEAGTGSVRFRDQTTPPGRTQSFIESKKSRNWFKRQFSSQMGEDYDSNNGIDHATAVAAAAFAIRTLEEPGSPDQKQSREQPQAYWTSDKSKKEDKTIFAQEPGRSVSKRFSGETSFKIPEGQEGQGRKFPKTASTSGKAPEKPVGRAPSMKKTPTFADRLNSNGSGKPDLPVPITPAMPPKEMQRQRSTKPGSPTTFPTRQNSMRPATEETGADAWEKAELAKIKDRYEKLTSTINSWEDKKKEKAKQRLHLIESELEGRRTKALEEFSRDMQNIGQIAVGARAQAEERKRNDELKAKEKANRIRTTGKIPKTCFCF